MVSMLIPLVSIVELVQEGIIVQVELKQPARQIPIHLKENLNVTQKWLLDLLVFISLYLFIMDFIWIQMRLFSVQRIITVLLLCMASKFVLEAGGQTKAHGRAVLILCSRIR